MRPEFFLSYCVLVWWFVRSSSGNADDDECTNDVYCDCNGCSFSSSPKSKSKSKHGKGKGQREQKRNRKGKKKRE